jgi:histidyl-tRNA synthetase
VSQKIAGVKGMNDLLAPDIAVWHALEAAIRRTFERFGYEEARTPVVEDTALFVRSVGEATDIVGKEMYTFEDKAGRSLSLRPEGTAPLVRAYIEHAVAQKEPLTRWWYLGPMFRYERMKTGRYRQFWQVGAEAYGAAGPVQEAELIDLAMQLFRSVGLGGIRLEINSLGDADTRPLYLEQLRAFLRRRKGDLCAECQERIEKNPLRVFDCKNPGCQAVLKEAPAITDALGPEAKEHFAGLQRKLAALDIPFTVNPRMVRGLDYYGRTAFEFLSDDAVLGTASAVGGGGRYDRLVKELGGPDTPAVGWALGMDRLCLLMRAAGEVKPVAPELFVAVAEEGVADAALAVVSRLRKAGHRVDFDPRGGSLKSQMKRADRSGATFALVLGTQELTSGTAELKPLGGGDPISVRLDALETALASGR